VTVEIAQGPSAEGGYGSAAKFAIEVQGMDMQRVRGLAEAGRGIRPDSRAKRGNIEVETVVV
jgi:hypothetical protein